MRQMSPASNHLLPTSHCVLASKSPTSPIINIIHPKPPPEGGGPSGWRPALGTAQQSSSSSSPPAAGVGVAGGDHGGVAVRPAVAFGADARAGFGTCSTGARVTVGGALMAEQVRVCWTGRQACCWLQARRELEWNGGKGGGMCMLISCVPSMLWIM